MDNKNIVVIPAMGGLDDISYKKYCINTWKYWCNKNDVQLFVLEEPVTDVRQMKPTWQRWHVLDILDMMDVGYNQVALVDIDTMVRWDAPNIFDYTDNLFSACVDNDNIGWVKQSIDGYQKYFKGVEFDWTTYFNCGMIVLNKKHKDLCKSITDFWYDNSEELAYVQNTLRKGTDQTPVNYSIRCSSHKLNLLNKKWNLTHLNRKEVLQNFMFVDCGYIWHFNGFEKDLRQNIMKQTWDNFRNKYED